MERMVTLVLTLIFATVLPAVAVTHENSIGSDLAVWVLLGLFGIIVLLQILQALCNRKYH